MKSLHWTITMMKLSPETSRHPPHAAQHFNKLHSHSHSNHDSLPRLNNTPQSQSLSPVLTMFPSISVSAPVNVSALVRGKHLQQSWQSADLGLHLALGTAADIATLAPFNTFLLYQCLIMFHHPSFTIYLSSIHHHIVKLKKLTMNSVYICSRETECVLL